MYDVVSNELLRVDAAVAALLRDDAAAVAALSPPAHARAEEELASARAEGLLTSRRPSAMAGCEHCHGSDGTIEHLTLSLTDRCNLRCTYCPHTHQGRPGVRPHGERTMSTDVLDAAVRDFLAGSAAVNEPVLSVYGGEPLLAFPLLERVVAHLRRAEALGRVRLVVDTNGLLLADRRVRELIRTSGSHLQVSLDGPPEVHDRHRRTVENGPSHAKIMSGLYALLDQDPSAAGRIRFQVTLVDPRDLEAVSDWFRDNPLRAGGREYTTVLGVNNADLTGAPHLEPDAPPEVLASAWDRNRRRYMDWRLGGAKLPDPVPQALWEEGLIRWYHRSRRPLGTTVSPGGFCRAGVRRRHVTADGRWQPCERVGESHVLGTVLGGFDETAARGLTEEFVAAMAARCLDCWAMRQCSVCAAITSEGGGGWVDEAVCRVIRADLEGVFRLWLDMQREGSASLDFLRDTTVV